MRIRTALFTLALSSIALGAQAGTIVVEKDGPITAETQRQFIAAYATCEDQRVEKQIARVDQSVYVNFMSSCMARELGVGVAIINFDPAETPNTNPHETFAQAMGICQRYSLKQAALSAVGSRMMGYDPAYATYAAAAIGGDGANCLFAELPHKPNQ